MYKSILIPIAFDHKALARTNYATANNMRADLIIVGAHHPSAMDCFLGSTTARVAHHASCNAAIQRPQS